MRAFTYVANATPGVGTGATEVQNAQILISQLNDRKILMGKDAATQNTPSVEVNGGNATLRYLAKYVRTKADAVTTGRLVTYVKYSIVYP